MHSVRIRIAGGSLRCIRKTHRRRQSQSVRIEALGGSVGPRDVPHPQGRGRELPLRSRGRGAGWRIHGVEGITMETFLSETRFPLYQVHY